MKVTLNPLAPTDRQFVALVFTLKLLLALSTGFIILALL
jgi:hypothetical protein